MNTKIPAILVFAIATSVIFSVSAGSNTNTTNNSTSQANGHQITTLIGEEYRVKTFMSAQQIQQLSQQAEAGDANAALKLAFHYKAPAFAKPDPEKSLNWMRIAYQLGHPEAMFHMAMEYQNENLLAKDDTKALSYLAEAIMADHSHAYRAAVSVLAKSDNRMALYTGLAEQFAAKQPQQTGEYLFRIASYFSGADGVLQDLLFLQDAYEVAIKHGSIKASYYYASRKWLTAGDNYDFDKALPFITPLASSNKGVANSTAWEMCTDNNPQLRHPATGLKFIASVKLFPQDYDRLDTLAACHAATGDFDQAVVLQEKVVNGLKKNFQPDEEYAARLALYKDAKPYIQAKEVDEEGKEKVDEIKADRQ